MKVSRKEAIEILRGRKIKISASRFMEGMKIVLTKFGWLPFKDFPEGYYHEGKNLGVIMIVKDEGEKGLWSHSTPQDAKEVRKPSYKGYTALELAEHLNKQ